MILFTVTLFNLIALIGLVYAFGLLRTIFYCIDLEAKRGYQPTWFIASIIFLWPLYFTIKGVKAFTMRVQA